MIDVWDNRRCMTKLYKMKPQREPYVRAIKYDGNNSLEVLCFIREHSRGRPFTVDHVGKGSLYVLWKKLNTSSLTVDVGDYVYQRTDIDSRLKASGCDISEYYGIDFDPEIESEPEEEFLSMYEKRKWNE